jgi:glutamate decarboxylase
MMLSKHVRASDLDPAARDVAPMFGSRAMARPIPRYELPEEETSARVVYQLIHDEMSLDGTPLLNLASFVTTWMEPEADLLAAEVAGKNFIDQEEYPIPTVIERRCVSILADLFHGPSSGTGSVGTSTIGSSEAIHLCGLALKRNWQARRAAAGADASRPNLVMSSAVHVTWEKFCRYFEVEPRQVPLEQGRWTLDPQAATARCDEHTIGVVGILGSTYTGHFDPIAELDAAVTAWNAANDGHLAIHVDAASGGFVAPFAYPDLAWDFRLDNVRSINVSGHKYGLVYPGVGWAIWRDTNDLPEDLVFHDSYLGNDQSTFDLNFSKPTAGVVGQYYNLIRLGRAGYTSIMHNALDTCAFLADEVTRRVRAEVISEPGHLPVLCARLLDESLFNAHDVARALRQKGWIVPAYTMPADLEDMSVLRVVVREGFSRDMAVVLLDDLHEAAEALHLDPPPSPAPHRPSKQRVC